jgi:uncharacterized protein (TIGR03435 family)
MTDVSDMELLRDYDRHGSEAAFAELVRRHVGLVYSTALRRVEIAAHAEEITQAVFVILARKAAGLRPGTVLEGWLHEATRLAALSFLRTERRRQWREQEAGMSSTLHESTEDPAWNRFAPLLDEAMGRLGQKDREALILRYFKEKKLDEVAAALQVSEVAAQRRVHRAVEKLRKFFARRGVVLPAAALTTALTANSIHAAPAGLAGAISTVAAAKGAAAGGSTLTLIKGALKLMAWTKLKTAAVVGLAALLTAGTTTFTVRAVRHSRDAALESYFTRLDGDYLETAPPMVLLRPSRYASLGSYCAFGRDIVQGKVVCRGSAFSLMLVKAYGFGPEQTIMPPNPPQGQFDLLLTVPDHAREALRAEIKKQFGLVAHVETREQDVLVLKCINPRAPGLKISPSDRVTSNWQPDRVKFTAYKMSAPGGYDVVHVLGEALNLPVIDETGLTNAYDIDFPLNPQLQGDALKQEALRTLAEQLGLQLIPDHRPIEMLVVEKVK